MAKRGKTIDPEVAVERILRQQLKAFRKRFGRDPLPGDPVFFDPDQDTPMEMTEEQVHKDMLVRKREVGAVACSRTQCSHLTSH
jgi:hypothetical protein